MSFDPRREIQHLAPTDSGGFAYAVLARMIADDIGPVTVSEIGGDTLGVASMGGARPARVLVMDDGLSDRSGCRVYTPLIYAEADPHPVAVETDMPVITIDLRDGDPSDVIDHGNDPHFVADWVVR